MASKTGQTIQIQSVEISTIAHATDDLQRIEVALTRLLPDSLKDRQLFTRQYVEGHHGNPIITFEARLTKRSDVEDFTTFFQNLLPKKDRLIIERDLDLHSDAEGNLYIRIDKQRSYLGMVQLGEDDPIRVRLKFSRFTGKFTDLMIKYLEYD